MLTRRELVLMVAAQAATALPIPHKSPATEKEAFTLQSERGLYLPLTEYYRNAPPENGPFANGNLQSLAQNLAMQGDVIGAWRAGRAAAGGRTGLPAPDLLGARVRDALEAIAGLARTRRVVIINDDHQTSRTRAFAHAVALRLYEVGFRTLAAETFTQTSPDLADFSRGGPLTPNAGFYTRDPVYAEMMRDLRSRGWRFVPYEQKPDQETIVGDDGKPLAPFAAREEAQARNLAEALHSRPGERLLVFSGQGHALKTVSRGLMGARLLSKGVDFAFADQTLFLAAPEGEADLPGAAVLLDKLRPSHSVALSRVGGDDVLGDGARDLVVVHPRVQDVSGRPGWLARAPGRRAAYTALPPELPAGALVQAVPQEEAATAVNVIPSDQYPLRRVDERRAVFLLRPGAYLVRVETLEGRREVGRLNVRA